MSFFPFNVIRAYLDIGGMDAFFREHFLKKMRFWLLVPPKQMSFIIISNENILRKTQGTRLGEKVVPNKGLE